MSTPDPLWEAMRAEHAAAAPEPGSRWRERLRSAWLWGWFALFAVGAPVGAFGVLDGALQPMSWRARLLVAFAELAFGAVLALESAKAMRPETARRARRLLAWEAGALAVLLAFALLPSEFIAYAIAVAAGLWLLDALWKAFFTRLKTTIREAVRLALIEHDERRQGR